MKLTRRRIIITAALALIIAAAILIHYYPRRRFGAGRVRLVITKTSLGKTLPGYIKSSQAVSSDCTRLAYVVKRGYKQAAVVNGQAGQEYYYVQPLHFSPDGKRLAYSVSREGNWFVVVDGTEGEEYRNVRCLRFSPDSRRLAYVATPDLRGEFKSFVVLDGVEGQGYDGIHNDVFNNSFIFSPDGSRLAYIAVRGDKWLAVVDGVEGKEYDEVSWLYFSPDGKHMAYVAKRGDKQLAVVDGVEGKECDEIHHVPAYNPHAWSFSPDFDNPLRFSPDSKHLAHPVRRAGKWFLMLDRVEGKPYGSIEEYGFAPDGRLVQRVEDSGKSFVVLDGVEGKRYDQVSMPHFSEDGRRWAYEAEAMGRKFVVVDGVEGKRYDNVGYLRFGPDGTRFAYAAAAGKKHFVVVDGVEGTRHRAMRIIGVDFSPNGEHALYAVVCRLPVLARWDNAVADWVGSSGLRHGGTLDHFIVVDGIEDRKYDKVSRPIFSPDGTHIAYIGRRNDKHFCVVDGVERREADPIRFWTSIMYESTKLAYVSEVDGEFFRMEARLVSE